MKVPRGVAFPHGEQLSFPAVTTLEIRNANNVTVRYEVANLVERSIAFIIDLIILGVFTIALVYLIIDIFGEEALGLPFYFSILSVGYLYFSLTEYLGDGRTFGKSIIGLRTIRTDGASATYETFAVRAAMLYLEFLASSGLIGLLAAASNEDKQRIGDRIAQTVVIRARRKASYELSDFTNLRTAQTESIVFENANQLTLDQALFIKTLISRLRKGATPQLFSLAQQTSNEVIKQLNLTTQPAQYDKFLEAVLRDYILLTR